jgi:hypothetical protein
MFMHEHLQHILKQQFIVVKCMLELVHGWHFMLWL